MTKRLLMIVFLTGLVVFLGMAQTAGSNNPILVKDQGLQVGAQLGGMLGDNEQPREFNDLGANLRFSYRVFLDFGLMDRVRAQFGAAYGDMAGKYSSTGLTPIDGRLMYFPSYSPLFSPYLYAGVGALRYKINYIARGRLSPGVSTDGWVGYMPIGVGFVTQFSHRIALDVNAGWNDIFSDKTNGRLGSSNDSYWSARIGLRIPLGETAYDREREEMQQKLAEQERLKKEADLLAAEEQKRKDAEAKKALEEQLRKAEEARKALEAQKPAEPPALKPEPAKPVTPEIKFEPVYFPTGGAILEAAERAKLDAAAKTLKENPDINLEVSGHTDNVGSRAVNEKIALMRANAVKNYLVRKGIRAERLTVQGYAIDRPAADNATVDGRSLNRRAELEIKK